jgi:predicted O-linked N-acetylglucosamine transferase (SPINDLY family)
MAEKPQILNSKTQSVKFESQPLPEIAKLIQEGLKFHNLGQLNQAKLLYEQVLNKDSNHFDAFQLLAAVYSKQKQYELALKYFDQALRINKSNAAVFNNCGNTLHELKRFNEALQRYNEALRLKPEYVDALCNRGNTLRELNRLEEALQSYNEALRLKPEYAEACNNRGNTLRRLNRLEEAVQSYNEALRLKPEYVDALYNRGNTLRELNRFDEALKSYDQVLSIKPGYEWLLGAFIHLKQHLCKWNAYESDLTNLKDVILKGVTSSTPFPILGLIDDLETQKKIAVTYSQKRYPSQHADLINSHLKRNGKYRIGYFSADFHNHATLHLMMDVFRQHNHSEFEIYAFSFGPDKKDKWRKELESHTTKLIDVRNQSDAQIALLSREIGIDIAVDLKGFTKDSRFGIFSHRAAPIQINYLGYPGTTGAKYIDYIIADEFLIPKESREYYTEKVLYLPNCYQPNIRKKKVSDKSFSRVEFGLPEDKIVFCSFNSVYKITPEMFTVWMDILRSVPESVMWILVTQKTARENLRQEAKTRGIDPSRIIFADQLPIEEHLKRIQLADLFLDTYPYNAHTSASDCLRMGVPLVTLAGKSFASRVAGSLLTALKLPELITHNYYDYLNLVLQIIKWPNRLNDLKFRLQKNLIEAPLLDSCSYTRNLEFIYRDVLLNKS